MLSCTSVLAQTTRVSIDSAGAQGNADSYFSGISADGRYVAFMSYASNLVPGDTNGTTDVFRHDRQTGATTRLSVDSAGMQSDDQSGNYGVLISANGQFAAFDSFATNLVSGDTNGRWDLFLREDCLVPAIYCTAKLNSIGCLPAIASTGVASASAGSGFTVTAANVRNQKSGLLIYSVTGRNNVPFQGGFLCLMTPV